MRKMRILSIILLFFCFTGIVHASSIHGDYNGEPIVKVLSGGKELQVEDVPATLHDGRTLVPLYLLRQAGISVKWDSEKYNVDLTIPSEPNSIKEFISTIKSLNVKAKDYSAKNLQLIYNEYGPYLKVDLELSYDSNKDNDHMISLSSFVVNSPADMLVVNCIHNNKTTQIITINRTDAEEFSKKQIPEYEYIKKWGYPILNDTTDLSTPNIPPVPAPPTSSKSIPTSGPVCRELTTAYLGQIHEAVESYNRSGSSDAKGIQQYTSKLEESMKEALKNANCPQQ